jgi:hypothetical protein
MVIALFVGLEPFTNVVLETVLYAGAAGVSQVALLVSVATLTAILREQRRLVEAAVLARQALAILRQSRGDDHPDLAADLQMNGVLLRELGRLAEAEPLLREGASTTSCRRGVDTFQHVSTRSAVQAKGPVSRAFDVR